MCPRESGGEGRSKLLPNQQSQRWGPIDWFRSQLCLSLAMSTWANISASEAFLSAFGQSVAHRRNSINIYQMNE